MKSKVLAILMSLCLIILSAPVYAGPDDYVHEEANKIYKKTNLEELMAKSAILMDVDSGRILFQKNEDEKLPIASVTKIMTIMLTLEAIDSGKIKLEDKVTVSEDAEAMGGSEVYLKAGEMFTVNELLKAIIVHSANDVCVAMAEFLAGSESIFVEQMNKKAKDLGMLNTNYLDCTGLTDEGHYSSAHDIGILSRELLTKHPKVMDYTKIWMDTFRNGTFRLDNTNKMVKYYAGTTGLKTGFTTKAGYCVAVSAKHEDTHLLSIVLGEPDSNTRFAEIRKLLDHGFANFKKVEILKKGEEVGSVVVDKGKSSFVKVVTKDNLSMMLSSDEQGKVKKETAINSPITAPVTMGAKVGDMIVKIDGQDMAKVELISNQSVEKASVFLLLIRKIASWFGIVL